MKKSLILSAAAAAVIAGLAMATSESRADGPVPACSAGGDKDQDLVPDEDDSAETDSCDASSTGFEDCETGAGDGIPDCSDTSN